MQCFEYFQTNGGHVKFLDKKILPFWFLIKKWVAVRLTSKAEFTILLKSRLITHRVHWVALIIPSRRIGAAPYRQSFLPVSAVSAALLERRNFSAGATSAKILAFLGCLIKFCAHDQKLLSRKRAGGAIWLLHSRWSSIFHEFCSLMLTW